MNSSESKSPTSLQKLETSLAALADAERLRILALIYKGGEVCNCHLEAVTGFIPSKISRHLAQLRAAGWVQSRREGTWIHYSLNNAAPTPGLTWLRSALDDTIARDELLQTDQAKFASTCCPNRPRQEEPQLESHLL